ncbi:YobI family P-loop NTPase [Pseudomonas brenneri]
MLKPVVAFFHSVHDRGTAMICQGIGQYRRYTTALRKALQAAQDFLRVSNGTTVFEPLTPVLLDLPSSQRYELELLSALGNDQVRNIAITGEYGAGKSSVIRTFVDRHPEFNFAFISLAAFGKERDQAGDSRGPSASAAQDQATPGAPEKKTAVLANDADLSTRIEEAIVQQLLYAVPSKQLPKTRLKRIVQASLSALWGYTAFFVLMLVSALRLYVPVAEKPLTIIPEWLRSWLMLFPDWMAVTALGVGGVYLVFFGLRLLSSFSIDGLTIKGGKLETTHHGSVLHKNVDEIIYCFERSNINVVVIEDLDRFGIQDVFTRLREINFIIKQSPQIRRRVYFVYALRDELFAVGEKTKFFDLIIPIIPVVNSENSREKMIELLGLRKLNGVPLDTGLDPNLLETVSYFIDDMRLIKNIVNEFDMFSSILRAGSGLKLDPNKLFAIIAIRNLHPNEYAELVKRRGLIYETLHGFREWRSQLHKKVESVYQALREERERKVQEVAKSTAELRAYVWLEMLDKSGASYASHVDVLNANRYTLSEFVVDDAFNLIFSQSSQLAMVAIDKYGQTIRRSVVPGAPIEFLASTTYQKRYDLLQKTMDSIDTKIAEQRLESSQINRLTFRGAAKQGYGEVILQNLAGLKIVIYLMRHGYLDTDYPDYFGYFYPGSLTAEDKNLLLGLRGGAIPDVTTVISAPKTVVGKLDVDDLGDGRGIIATLIDYLVSGAYSAPDWSHERELLMTIFRNGLKDHLGRMAEAAELLISGPSSHRFVRAIFEFEPSLFRALLTEAPRFETVIPKQLLIGAILDGLTPDQLQALDVHPNTEIRNTIEALEDNSRLMPQLKVGEGGWSWLKTLPVQFSHLGETTPLDDLAQLIEWRCIDFNLHMLTLICQRGDSKTSADLQSKSAHNSANVTYSRLKALNIKGLDEQLLESPDALASVLLSQTGELDESAESLSTLLKVLDHAVETTGMQQLFARTTCEVERLEDIPQVLWVSALSTDRVSMQADAVWSFFDKVLLATITEKGCEQADMDAFADFIKRHTNQLSKKLWTTNNVLHVDLQGYLLGASEIDNETVVELFAELTLNNPVILSGSFGKLPAERWAMLASADFLAFTPEIRDCIRMYDLNLEVPYLLAHWRQAREHIDFTQLPTEMVLRLSQSSVLTLDAKVTMWTAIPVETFDTHKVVATEIARLCSSLNEGFSRFPVSFAPILRKLIAEDGLSSEQRQAMLAHCLASSTWTDVAALLGLLAEGFDRLAPNVKKIEVESTAANLRFMTALRARGFVGSVTTKGDMLIANTRPSEMKDTESAE